MDFYAGKWQHSNEESDIKLMNFSEVKAVSIPQGEVTKIAETQSGRILWEKMVKLTGRWENVTINLNNPYIDGTPLISRKLQNTYTST